MKWSLKGGISIDADSGTPRYVLWCYGGICHQPDTFIQIGSGHTVCNTDMGFSWNKFDCMGYKYVTFFKGRFSVDSILQSLNFWFHLKRSIIWGKNVIVVCGRTWFQQCKRIQDRGFLWQNIYLVQLIEHPILWIPNFNFPNSRCCIFFLFNKMSYIGIYGCILILI